MSSDAVTAMVSLSSKNMVPTRPLVRYAQKTGEDESFQYTRERLANIVHREIRIDSLKQAYVNKNVDNRFYSTLPHYIVQQYTRVFWKPTCDKLQQEMAEFEVRDLRIANPGFSEMPKPTVSSRAG
jgi:hypothetical protein